MSSKRPMSAEAAKAGIMGVALACTGVFEFFEGLEAGDPPLKAADKALTRTKLRAEVVKKAARRAARKIQKVEG